MLCLSGEAGYLQEPFNPLYGPEICGTDFEHNFQYVSGADAERYEEMLRRTLSFRIPLSVMWEAHSSPRGKYQALRYAARYLTHRISRRRALMKDPIAIFSTEWLARVFSMDVVILIRHPGAFAQSLKRRDWRFDFRILLDQPDLMDDLLGPHADEMEALADDRGTIVEQAALIWKIIYSLVGRFRQEHPDWYFVRHEDLAATPITEFQRLYQHLGLSMTPEVQRRIEIATNEDSDDRQIRDSLNLVDRWKRDLDPSELSLLRERTSPIWERYYPSSSWDPASDLPSQLAASEVL